MDKLQAEEAAEPPGAGIAPPTHLAPPPLPKSRANRPARVASLPGGGGRFVVSARSEAFRQRFFPGTILREWNDWRWQNRHRIRTLDGLQEIVHLSDEERAAIARHRGSLPVGVTPYYLSLLDPADSGQALRRTVIPVLNEYQHLPAEHSDPLSEDAHSPVPGLVHRYPDRVLLLVTNFCSVYCRYCTRARLVGATGERSLKKTQVDRAIDYIASNPSIRDVLISGGDPLSLSEDRLEYLLNRLRAIEHVEFLRIGTKQPVVQPMRITRDLVRILRRYHLWMSLHFTHPDELTPEVAEACARLADAGIPLGSQTVLLKGINDDLTTLRRLFHGLLKIRVRPYYLYQCDPILGSGHFRTSVEAGMKLIGGLRGHTTGYAIPHFVVDAPRGGGKIALLPDPIIGRDGDDLLIKNFVGDTFRYPDAGGRTGSP